MILDFTGWACVNCRKMEQVWPDATVAKPLRKSCSLVALRRRAPGPAGPTRVEQFGSKDFESVQSTTSGPTFRPRSSAQRTPFYVMIDHNGEALGDDVGYDPDPQKFIDFLKENYARFETGK